MGLSAANQDITYKAITEIFTLHETGEYRSKVWKTQHSPIALPIDLFKAFFALFPGITWRDRNTVFVWRKFLQANERKTYLKHDCTHSSSATHLKFDRLNLLPYILSSQFINFAEFKFYGNYLTLNPAGFFSDTNTISQKFD